MDLTVKVLEEMQQKVNDTVDPRKVVGIWACPRMSRYGTVEEWKIIGVVTAPCSLHDRGRL